MKILQLTVHYSPNIGGVETHLTDLVSELARKQHTIFVLTYRPLVAKSNWKMFERSKGTTIWRLPWLPGFFYKFNASPVIEFLYLMPGIFLITPFVILLFNPEVIHAHGLIAGFVGTFWGKLFRKKVVISTHSLYHFPASGLYYSFAKKIFTNASKVLCLSNQSVEEIEGLGVKKENCSRFTYWVDTNVFKPEASLVEKLGWKNKFVVLFIGRLVPEKGIRELINSAEMVDNSFLFVLIGDGPLAAEIEQAAEKSNGKIVFINKISNTDLPQYYNSATVVIIPSVHDEGFGRVILEALSCGVPVVASNRGAIPEAINSSVGELLTITPENIAKSLRQLQKNSTKLKAMRKNAREFALQRYTNKNVNTILNAYKSDLT